MTPDQIPRFLKAVSLTDARLLPSDTDEALAMTALWAVALADVDYAFALEAVARHYAKSPYQVRPSDIAAQWRTQAARRAERYVDPIPMADPDNPTAYAAELKTTRREAIATVTPIRPPRAALGPGAPQVAALSYGEDDVRAMRAQGDLAQVWKGGRDRAHAENARRKQLVLQHPDLAERLTKAPLNYPRPDQWSGYVPESEVWQGARNNSPAVAALWQLLAEAEARTA